MKVLIVTPKLTESGGVSSFWISLLPQFQKKKDLKVVNLEVGGSGLNLLNIFRNQWSFRKHLSSKYDLVLINPSLGSRSFLRDSFFIIQLLIQKNKFIVFFHGWDLYFEKIVNRYFKWFFRNTFGKAEIIFVLSSEFQNSIYKWNCKARVILETTNVNSNLIKKFKFEKKVDRMLFNKKIRILFLARLLREKGVFEAVEAFRILYEKNSNLELNIAGDGSDLEELKSLVLFDTGIKVLGRVEGKEKISLFEKCDIYCFPTYYGEGLPTTILEAMAFGMPVVTTNVGGIKDFFEIGKMGYIVELKNVAQIVDKLEGIIEDRKSMVEMGNFNRDYANKNFLDFVVANRIYKHFKA